MRSKILLLVAFIFSAQLNAQKTEAIPATADSLAWTKSFSVYTAPLALFLGDCGSGLRVGFDKGFGQRSSAGLEFTMFKPWTRYLTNVSGTRIRAEYRSYLPKTMTCNEASYWGISFGVHRQTAQSLTGFPNPADSSVLVRRATYRKNVEFFRAGMGMRGLMNEHWYVDISFWLGFRNRSVDIDGLSEGAQRRTYIVGSDAGDLVRFAMRTTEYVAPDVSLSLRFGYMIGSR